MALKRFTKSERRELHLICGEVHPNVIARSARALKRSHRRLTRRAARQTLRSPVATE